jgi:hypothetical protein
MLPQRIRNSAFIIMLLAVFGILATAQNASAQLQVRFEDPDQPSLPALTVGDNDPNDLEPDPGIIAIFGITYGKFRIDQVVVLSKPAIGDSSQTEVDVNASVSSTLGGKLTVTASDTGFADPSEASLTLSTSVGGTISGTGSTISFATWADPGNGSSPGAGANVALGPFFPPPNSFSGNGSTSFARIGPYSIIKQAQVVLAANGTTGWDHSTLVNGLHSSTELITSSVSPGTSVISGTPVTIEVLETNTGDTTITGVHVTGTGCTPWSGGLSTLAPGASTTFSCTFTPTTTTDWTATGHGTDPAGNPVPLDNETTGGTITVFTASTVLTTKSVTPGTQVAVGAVVTVTVTETNTGNSTISDVNVTGTGACSSFSPANVPSLAAGAAVDFTCTFTATNHTSWTATGHGTDALGQPVSLDNETTSGTVTVFTASTSLTTKSVTPGTTISAGTTVTIKVNEKNTGNSTITNVFVTGTGCTTWTPASVASLAAGAAVEFSCSFAPSVNTAWSATGHGTDLAGNPVSLVGEYTSGNIIVIHPATVLTTKYVSDTIVKPGTSVTIKVKEMNTGDSTITNVKVTGTGCTTWTPSNVASLAPGAWAEFTCVFSPTYTKNWTATGHGTDILGNPVPYDNETTGGTITVDGTKPVCSVYATANPPYMTFFDGQSGIVRLDVTTNLNKNYKVKITPTPAGTTFSPSVPYQPYPMPAGQVIDFPSPVTTTITTTAYKINSVSSQLTIQATDAAGNTISCDPIETTLVKVKQDNGNQTFYNVPAEETMVTVENGGLRAIEIEVNNKTFKVKRLSDDEVRKVDISSAMKPGNNNTITLIPKGKKGETADVTIGPPE